MSEDAKVDATLDPAGLEPVKVRDAEGQELTLFEIYDGERWTYLARDEADALALHAEQVGEVDVDWCTPMTVAGATRMGFTDDDGRKCSMLEQARREPERGLVGATVY